MHPLYCVSFGSRQTALEKLRWYLNQSHSYEQNHLWDVSLSCEYRSWRGDFSKGRSRITAWVARFLWKRSWRTVPVARCITNVSVCFIQLSKNSGESLHRLSCVKAEGRTGKGEFNKSCPACICYLFGSSISNSQIIFKRASLIRPLSSISTTMQTFPYSS